MDHPSSSKIHRHFPSKIISPSRSQFSNNKSQLNRPPTKPHSPINPNKHPLRSLTKQAFPNLLLWSNHCSIRLQNLLFLCLLFLCLKIIKSKQLLKVILRISHRIKKQLLRSTQLFRQSKRSLQVRFRFHKQK